jgi:hypothetical protein
LHNGVNLDLEAVWPYGIIGDTGPDSALATRTYQHRTNVYGPDWSFDALQAARLGLGSEVAAALTHVTQSYQAFANGLALLSGGNNGGTSEPYVEQLGVVAAALNEALVQDYDGTLRLAPAWPQGWDAAGTVFVQRGSKVHVQVKSGSVTMAVVEAGATGTMDVRNPWPGQPAMVVDGDTSMRVVAPTSGNTVALQAVAGHWYAIVPAGQTSLPTIGVTGVPAASPKTFGPVRIGH